MPTKKNVKVAEEEVKKNESTVEDTVDEVEEHDFIDDYTIEECREELDSMDLWYRDRKKALNDRIKQLEKEANDREMIDTIKNLRDNLIATGINPAEVDGFIIDSLKHNMGMRPSDRDLKKKIDWGGVSTFNAMVDKVEGIRRS
jgi:hypothetical protein